MNDIFALELSWILDDAKRAWCAMLLNLLPDAFYQKPASSSGKYHPQYSLGEGGLARHVRGAVLIARNLLPLDMYSGFTENQRDNIICALLLHDGMKYGEDGDSHTVFSHPLDMVDWLRKQEWRSYISEADFNEICDAVGTHMGQWTTSKYSDAVLPAPETDMQKFVHLCDYLASRRFLEVDFDRIETPEYS